MLNVWRFAAMAVCFSGINVVSAAQDGWPMAGANPQRTSWTSEEVRGSLKLAWYRRIEPYIPQKVQVIAADGMLFVSTASGLYAFDAATGEDRWVYPTALPLGHSPTVYQGTVYAGCFDRRIHALDVKTGKVRWVSDPAGAGYATNPLVVEGKVIAGNRDGFLYALDAASGKEAWKLQTGGPILFSPAYEDGMVYIASNDSHAYAVDAKSGKMVWKSEKFPGSGFHSWWPVVHQGRVILAGSRNYSLDSRLRGRTSQSLQFLRTDLTPDKDEKLPGEEEYPKEEWMHGREGMDLSRTSQHLKPVTEYFEEKPWRRTYFVLDCKTGKEVTYDFDKDGKPEYAPLLPCGTQTGNRYPPVVGPDGVLYQFAGYKNSIQNGKVATIPRGGIVGWKMDGPCIALVNGFAVDEPLAYAIGGNVLYSNHCVSRGARGEDILNDRNEWQYFNISGKALEDLIPEIWSFYGGKPLKWQDQGKQLAGHTSSPVFGGRNGLYGLHGDQNSPIPCGGMVYMHRNNYLIAFSPEGGGKELAMAKAPSRPADVPDRAKQDLQVALQREVEKLVEAGHLRPGYAPLGFFEVHSGKYSDYFYDHFSQPGETIVILLRALPHLPPELQAKVKQYVQAEFEAYPPDRIAHIGWAEGAPREIFDVPPEIKESMQQVKTSSSSHPGFGGWKFPPHANYALWQYARVFGDAESLAARLKPLSVPNDEYLQRYPYVHNAYIAGLIGTLELTKLAGKPEPQETRQELDRLLTLRASTFSKDAPSYGITAKERYEATLIAARNFMFLTPELAAYLRDHALDKVKEAVAESEFLTSYWFVAKAEDGIGENIFSPLWNYHDQFQARAMIHKAPYAELQEYIDVPAFAVGDLYYIDNVVAALEADQAAASNTTETGHEK